MAQNNFEPIEPPDLSISRIRRKTDYFKKTLKDQNDGVRKIVDWLKKKVGLNKHADIVRVLNKFFNATRNKNENLGSRRPSKK